MKKCNYCAEEIQDDALKCRYCGEFLAAKQKDKWYLRTNVLIIAFLCIGPFALPLFWINPHFSRRTKIILTVIIIIVSYFLGVLVVNSLKSIVKYYQEMFALMMI